jgi:hypothetical protein
VKINEVILEALNKSTGTPNANPVPPPEAPAPADADQTQWTGRKPAATPDELGRVEPTMDPAAPATTPAPAKPDYSQKPGAYSTNPGVNATYNVPTGVPNTTPPPVTPTGAPAPSAPVDTAYQDQLDQNIQQKQQATLAANQTTTPAQKAKQGLKNFGGALAKGIKGAVKGFNQSRDMNQARAAGGDNLNLEFDAFNKLVQQRGAVADMRDPAELQNTLKSWANSRYPSAGNAVDVSTVQPGNKRSIEDYITKMYSAAMSNRSLGIKPLTPDEEQAKKDKEAGKTTQPAQASTLIDPNTGKPFVTAPANQPATEPATTATAPSTAPGPDAHDDKDIEHDMVPGMEIIQKEPIIVKYKNREFGLNDQGEWVHLGGTKTPHQSFQAMLDKAAGFSESFDPGKMLWDKMKK